MCCPECAYKSKDEILFESHALENHPKSSVLFEKIKDSENTAKPPDYAPPKPSQWTPPSERNPHIDTFVNQVRGHLDTFLQSTKVAAPNNLPTHEHRALRDLKNNNDIVIRQADKGGAITLLDRNSYIMEAETQLSNGLFYKEQACDRTQTYHKELTTLVGKIENSDTRELIMSLIPPLPRAGNFYTIPKLHKLEGLVSKHIERQGLQLASFKEDDIVSLAKTFNIAPPGRPIVSGKGTLTEYISGFIDSILQRLMPHIPSFIQDTTDFLNKLATIKDIPDNSLLVTMDVTALYTNIPHDDGVRACAHFLNSFPVTEIPTKVICSLISFILTHNNFMFGDKHYIQVSGTAMGTKMAPCFANLFMASIEKEFIDNSPHKPLLYTRFIDDIFLLWTHGRPALDDFILRANSIHPTIKFTVDISNEKVPFLDVMVSLTPVGFKTSLYRKPTDRPTYLNYTSFHPPHIKS